MVLELVVNTTIRKNERFLVVYSFIVTSLALFISYYVFPAASSLISLFFITITMLPAFYRLLVEEEEVLERLCCGKRKNNILFESALSIFERNRKVIMAYTYLFVGVAFSMTFWYAVLPSEYTTHLFSFQEKTIQTIRGMATNPLQDFLLIFFNNLRVSFVAFVLSFLFGTGALFVITWNASVVAVFFGKIAKDLMSTGLNKGLAPLLAFFIGSSSIFLHAVPEITAYFLAGIAGGVLSVGVYRGRYTIQIVEDALAIYLCSVAVLLFAAFIEAYITPAL